MKLVVGLGNPGQKYADTRHNFGFMVLDQLKSQLSLSQWQEKFAGLLVKTNQIVLLQPQTFVNRSGESVGLCARFFQLSPEQIIVVHDDLDLALGQIKIKQGGSSAGHHGIDSIDEVIGADYWRLRLGIGRDEDAERFVLRPFSQPELIEVSQVVDRAVTNLLEWLNDAKQKN